MQNKERVKKVLASLEKEIIGNDDQQNLELLAHLEGIKEGLTFAKKEKKAG